MAKASSSNPHTFYFQYTQEGGKNLSNNQTDILPKFGSTGAAQKSRRLVTWYQILADTPEERAQRGPLRRAGTSFPTMPALPLLADVTSGGAVGGQNGIGGGC